MTNAALVTAALAFAAALIGTANEAAPPALSAAAVRLLFVLAAADFAVTAKVQYQEDRVHHDLGRPLSSITRPVTALAALAPRFHGSSALSGVDGGNMNP